MNRIPIYRMMYIGFTENDVMPSMARFSIFFSVYFDCPASRSLITSSTVVLFSPTIGTSPLRYRLRSW